MATVTGENLLQSIIESTGAEVNTLIRFTLSARLQQMIDNGTYSKLAASIAMSGFSTTINGTTEIKELSDAAEVNAGLIEATAEDEVDQIVFPPVGNSGGDPQPTTLSADTGTFTDQISLDAAQGSFIFTDDAAVETFVVISNFTSDDQIQINNLPAGDTYQFVPNGTDVDITYNYNDEGTMNHIKLLGEGNENDLYWDEAQFEDAIGFDAVTYA